MSSIVSLKGMVTLFAASTIAIAVSQSGPGGHFDRLTKIVRKNAGSTDASGSGGTTSGVTTTTTTTTAAPATTTSNLIYPEMTAIPSNFDTAPLLTPSWGNGAIAPSGAADVLGAFRFICRAGQVLRDDPIVMPGQPGKSHLHQFFGNTDANAFSTYSSLRQSGGSTCGDDQNGHALNRSSYWMPAMLDGVGNVVKPDYVSIYYKRLPMSSILCHRTENPGVFTNGDCIPLPNGLRYVAGFDMVTNTPKTGAAYFKCDGQTATGDHFESFAEAKANCPTAPWPYTGYDGKTYMGYNHIGAIINMPGCWDGVNLDSPNHRSHMSYGTYEAGCPATHPKMIPGFSMGVWYTVDANLGTWHFSSDEMRPDLPAGSTFHADWFGAWDNKIEAQWMDNCINKVLSCSGGDLGNGLQIFRADMQPDNRPRLSPVPN